ncbi:hydroxyacid dehydrogenase [Streptomyces sp. NPDC050625]|uniref:hydroxyacid dehydrogenase n=1 Tax=Streptomyces sp. NPDC050625 TaxID=3154629 RepID=UPI003434729E
MSGPAGDERLVVVQAMAEHLPGRLFPRDVRARLEAHCALEPGSPLREFHSARARAALARADVLLTGWGCPRVDAGVLARAPRLRAVVHAAGTVKEHLDRAVFERGIAVGSAAWANAIPVAEYTLAMILLANKGVPTAVREYRERRADLDLARRYAVIGNYRRRVGLVGASQIGRRVLELLRPFDLEVLLTDPFVTVDEAAALGTRLVGLPELFATSDLVSLHVPSVEATRGMVDARLLASMPDGATLLNTARGALVDQDALTAQLRTGRIRAVLDVTEPEVTDAASPLWDLPNVVLTPHIAGSLGGELARLGAAAVAEVLRVAAGLPLAHPVDYEALSVSA